MITILLTYFAIDWFKGSDPRVTFWLTFAQTVLLIGATLPVSLWVIDSARARKLRLDEFNALPLLTRVGGVFIPLWALWGWFRAAAQVKEQKFLAEAIPELKWVALGALLFVVTMSVTSMILHSVTRWRDNRAPRTRKKEPKVQEGRPFKTNSTNLRPNESIQVFAVKFESLKTLSASVSNVVLENPTHYLTEYFKFVRYYVEKCDLEAGNSMKRLRAFDNEVTELLSEIRKGYAFEVVPPDVELLPHIAEPVVQFEYLLGQNGLEFVGNGPQEMIDDPTKHLMVSFYAIFEALSTHLKGGDKEAALLILGAEIERVRAQSALA